MSVTLHTTHGDIKIEVFCEAVPKTAEVCCNQTHSCSSIRFPIRPPKRSLTALLPSQNFLALCASHYYDSSPFHRLIPNFMIQTGAPVSAPKAGSSIWDAPFEDEIRPSLRHNARGIASMANKGPGTNGSQFFICLDKAPHLDGKNTVFGHVLGEEGMRTLEKMETVEVDRKSRPKEEIKIERITVHANPLAG